MDCSASKSLFSSYSSERVFLYSLLCCFGQWSSSRSERELIWLLPLAVAFRFGITASLPLTGVFVSARASSSSS
ncbi:hypothetical protein [Phaffia rhodozyma]|uniref:Uncharacterized protein n=1 Tax=Phaffia rhodozyma TaxID=264483 RepID=A0A0F7SIM8_PHARH|nr:hypothetical protein [Phaffia rhodozyma]